MKKSLPTFESFTWDKYFQYAFALSRKIIDSQIKLDLIIAIARGGSPLSRVLSDALKLPVASFTAQSYQNTKQETIPKITYGLDSKLNGVAILLVDDVADTGKTIEHGIEYLITRGAKKENIITATISYKPHSSFKPEFYVHTTSNWIIYPYDIRETIEYLTPIWRKDNVADKEIKKRFLNFDFPKEQVEYFLGLLSP